VLMDMPLEIMHMICERIKNLSVLCAWSLATHLDVRHHIAVRAMRKHTVHAIVRAGAPLDVVQHALEKAGRYALARPRILVVMAAHGGRLDVVQWLYDNHIVAVRQQRRLSSVGAVEDDDTGQVKETVSFSAGKAAKSMTVTCDAWRPSITADRTTFEDARDMRVKRYGKLLCRRRRRSRERKEEARSARRRLPSSSGGETRHRFFGRGHYPKVCSSTSSVIMTPEMTSSDPEDNDPVGAAHPVRGNKWHAGLVGAVESACRNATTLAGGASDDDETSVSGSDDDPAVGHPFPRIARSRPRMRLDSLVASDSDGISTSEDVIGSDESNSDEEQVFSWRSTDESTDLDVDVGHGHRQNHGNRAIFGSAPSIPSWPSSPSLSSSSSSSSWSLSSDAWYSRAHGDKTRPNEHSCRCSCCKRHEQTLQEREREWNQKVALDPRVRTRLAQHGVKTHGPARTYKGGFMIDALHEAAAMGHANVFEWLLWTCAAQWGQLADDTLADLTRTAIGADRVAIIEHIHRVCTLVGNPSYEAKGRKGAPCKCPPTMGSDALVADRADIVSLLHDQGCTAAIPPNVFTLNKAVRRGSVRVAQWISTMCANEALSNGGERVAPIVTRESMTKAVAALHTPMVAWCHETGHCPCTPDNLSQAMSDTLPAADTGPRKVTDLLRWASGESCPCVDTVGHVWRLAGQHQHRPIAAWAPERILYWAIAEQNTECVEWLLKSECAPTIFGQCTLRMATRDLGILSRIVRARIVPPDAIDWTQLVGTAIHDREGDVLGFLVRYVRKHRAVVDGAAVMRTAMLKGSDRAMQLICTSPALCTDANVEDALRACAGLSHSLDALGWLRKNRAHVCLASAYAATLALDYGPGNAYAKRARRGMRGSSARKPGMEVRAHAHTEADFYRDADHAPERSGTAAFTAASDDDDGSDCSHVQVSCAHKGWHPLFGATRCACSTCRPSLPSTVPAMAMAVLAPLNTDVRETSTIA